MGGFAFIYGYFAFHFDDDPASCLADTDNYHHTHRLESEPDNGNYEDVGSTFRFGFLVLFICMMTAATGWILNHFFYQDKNIRVYFVLWMCVPAGLMNIITWIYLFVSRYNF